MEAVLLMAVHAGVTCFMAGLIWFVQIVHYPLFGSVGREVFACYEKEHTRRTGFVVVLPMLVELGTGLGILIRSPAGMPGILPVLGAILLLVVWSSTFLLLVPRHRRLSTGFDDRTHGALVRTNWIRTAAWSARAPLSLVMLMNVA